MTPDPADLDAVIDARPTAYDWQPIRRICRLLFLRALRDACSTGRSSAAVTVREDAREWLLSGCAEGMLTVIGMRVNQDDIDGIAEAGWPRFDLRGCGERLHDKT